MGGVGKCGRPFEICNVGGKEESERGIVGAIKKTYTEIRKKKRGRFKKNKNVGDIVGKKQS